MKRINTRRIKAKHSYFIDPLSKLLGVHSNTVHEWIKAGLQRIDNAYPYLIHGEDLIAFLNERQRKKKVSLAIDEFYCCTCHAPRKAWEGLADFEIRTSKTGNLKAICECCGKRLCKLVSNKTRAEIEKILTLHEVALVQPTNNSTNHETKGAEIYAKV